jgi:hypothetical protein
VASGGEVGGELPPVVLADLPGEQGGAAAAVVGSGGGVVEGVGEVLDGDVEGGALAGCGELAVDGVHGVVGGGGAES